MTGEYTPVPDVPVKKPLPAPRRGIRSLGMRKKTSRKFLYHIIRSQQEAIEALSKKLFERTPQVIVPPSDHDIAVVGATRL